ncbi:solute carrier family 2, facilitated glucose transporter member 8-like [Amblyomma americanum]
MEATSMPTTSTQQGTPHRTPHGAVSRAAPLDAAVAVELRPSFVTVAAAEEKEAPMETTQVGPAPTPSRPLLRSLVACWTGSFCLGTAIGFASLLLVGALGGSMVGALAAQSIGRRRTVAFGALGALCTWLCVASSQEVWYLYAGRVTSGFFAGMLAVVVPALIAELADARDRGRQGARHYVGTLVGLLYVHLLGRHVTWTTLAFACLVPAALLLPLSWYIVESPRWLIQVDRRDSAVVAQRSLRKEPVEANAEMKLIEKVFVQAPMPSLHYWLAAHLMFLQQFCGANVAAFIVEDAMDSSRSTHDGDATLAALLIQLAVATMVMPFVDTVGRLRLLVLSANICATSMVLLGVVHQGAIERSRERPTGAVVAVGAAENSTGPVESGQSGGVAPQLIVIFAALFNFGYAIGLGTVTWIQVVELAPLRCRGLVLGSVCSFHWACAFCSAAFFERVRDSFGFGDQAWFYATLTLANGLVLYYFMPETKGLTLEAILLEECPVEHMLGRRRSFNPSLVARRRSNMTIGGGLTGMSGYHHEGLHHRSTSASEEVQSPFRTDRTAGMGLGQVASTSTE